MSATIRDVAKLAGVSISTVSRVINKSKPVSEKSKERVLKAIEELNYKPNEIARSLVTRKSNVIGVVVEDIGLSFVSQVVRGIEEVARMYNYNILVSSTYGDPDVEDEYMRLMLNKQVDGIVVVSESNNPNRLKNIKSLGIPVAYLNRFYRNVDVSTVTISNSDATRDLTNYLIDNNHKDIIYIGNDIEYDISNDRFKRQGYQEAMEKIGVEPRIMVVNNEEEDRLADIKDEIIEDIKNGKITGIIVYSQERTIDLMNELYDAGISVPKDVSVVGIGDGELARIYRPRLTTIQEPLYNYGAISIRRIIKAIEGDGEIPEGRMLLPYQLIERESVRKL